MPVSVVPVTLRPWVQEYVSTYGPEPVMVVVGTTSAPANAVESRTPPVLQPVPVTSFVFTHAGDDAPYATGDVYWVAVWLTRLRFSCALDLMSSGNSPPPVCATDVRAAITVLM